MIFFKLGPEMMDTDEHPKPKTTVEMLSKLPSVFKKDGTVNAGNASVCKNFVLLLIYIGFFD